MFNNNCKTKKLNNNNKNSNNKTNKFTTNKEVLPQATDLEEL